MQFDILMPLFLFSIPLLATFLGKRAEGKLKSTIEEKEFGNKDTALFMTMIIVALGVIIFVPSQTILVLFLFSYASLLFTVSYAYSDMQPKSMLLYCGIFMIAGALAAIAGLSGVLPSEFQIYGLVAFAGFTVAGVATLLYALQKGDSKKKWYIAALSPALFLLLFIFYNQTNLWFPFLLDLYGAIFAILIVVYLAPMFNWKIIFIYAIAITAMDIVLVWGPGHLMVQAANALTNLNLPVLVWLPNIPPLYSTEGYLLLHGLGLGDLFFSGVLSFQTLKKFGTKTTIISMVAIAVSFGLYEMLLMNPELSKLLPVAALPATLPILTGWLPIIGIKTWLNRNQPKPQLPQSSITPP
jgi:hypothetical protein